MTRRRRQKLLRLPAAALCLLLPMLLTACGRPAAPVTTQPATTQAATTQTETTQTETMQTETTQTTDSQSEEATEMRLQLQINDTPVQVAWEANAAVTALAELCRQAPLTVPMAPYGGFEQVGPLGASLPRSDVRTATQAGDLVLYAGDQLVIFYGTNTWAYTRLGHITDRSPAELARLLGGGSVTVTLRLATD